MALFTIDASKCKKDKVCVAVCPLGLIEDANGVPTPVRDAEKLCISCGHCVSACTGAALSHRAMKPEQCMPMKPDLFVKPEQMDQLLRGRRSIRAFRNDPVERAVLEKLVRTASYGPSGHNTQPVEWLIIHDPVEVKLLAGMVVDWMRFMIKQDPGFANAILLPRVVEKWEQGHDAVCRSGPHVVLAHAHKENGMAPSACTIALAYLELAAQANGLGACWAGYVDLGARFWPPLQKELELPEGNVSYGAMIIGRPKHKYHRIPLRREAKISWK